MVHGSDSELGAQTLPESISYSACIPSIYRSLVRCIFPYMSSSPESERFRSEAHKYAAYLETPEGRLRSDLALANLEGLLPRAQTTTPLRALDVGGGTGTAAIQLARLGVQVTLLDSSEEMLDLANVNIRRSGLSEKVLLHPASVHL